MPGTTGKNVALSVRQLDPGALFSNRIVETKGLDFIHPGQARPVSVSVDADDAASDAALKAQARDVSGPGEVSTSPAVSPRSRDDLVGNLPIVGGLLGGLPIVGPLVGGGGGGGGGGGLLGGLLGRVRRSRRDESDIGQLPELKGNTAEHSGSGDLSTSPAVVHSRRQLGSLGGLPIIGPLLAGLLGGGGGGGAGAVGGILRRVPAEDDKQLLGGLFDGAGGLLAGNTPSGLLRGGGGRGNLLGSIPIVGSLLGGSLRSRSSVIENGFTADDISGKALPLDGSKPPSANTLGTEATETAPATSRRDVSVFWLFPKLYSSSLSFKTSKLQISYPIPYNQH